MHTITGSFKNGVAKPNEPIDGHEGQLVLITFLSDDGNGVTNETTDAVIPTLEEIVEKIRILGPTEGGYTPPTESLGAALASSLNESPIDPAEWNRQWASIEAEMKQRDLDDDRAEGRI